MSRSLKIYLHVILAILFAGIQECYAQDDTEDYHLYKFYKEEQDDIHDLWLDALLRLQADDTTPATGYSLSQNGDYSLSALGFSARGLGYDERRYLVGALNVDYTTARMLSSLGLKYDMSIGTADGSLSGGVGRTQRYLTKDRAYYRGHYLRGEFSGRNYLGGISYRARHKLQRDGVMLNDGWSFAHYVRGRTGRDLYVDGVYSNSLDLAAIASYSGRNDLLDIAISLPLSERGLRGISVDEAYSLTSDKLYNPSWGFQNGVMRNSRVARSIRPEIVTSWQRRLNATTDMHIAANVNFEHGGYTTLAWFNALSPMPDNYRYMPSYYADDSTSREVREAWLGNNPKYTQIDWEGIYHTNALHLSEGARYAVERRMANALRTAASAMFKSAIGGVDIEYGLTLDLRTTRKYKVMDDLLGASHIVDIDYYLIDDATHANDLQNNLINPNRIIGEGDRYGYDYRLTRSNISLNGAASYAWQDMRFDAALHLAMERTVRRGYYEKELFPSSGSYGRSKALKSSPYRINLSWEYHPDGHTIKASAMVRGATPAVDDMFLQTEYNNRIVEKSQLCTTLAADIVYSYLWHKLSLTAALFVTDSTNGSEVLHYYDDLASLYCDAVVRGIGRTRYGIEAAINIDWSRYLSSTFSLSAARYRYTRDAEVATYADTDNALIATSTARMRGLNIGAPELSAYGDLELHISGWMARLALSYAGSRYVDPSFVRRTERVVSFVQAPEQAEALMSQQHLRDAAILDLTISKRIKLKNHNTINIQLSANNLLGTSYIVEGYEQNRIRRNTIQGRTHIAPFDNRIKHSYPRSFYLSVGFGF